MPQSESLAKVGAFTMEEPVYGAQICFDRGLAQANTAHIDPATLPSDPAVIEALVNGTSLILDTLDAIGGDTAAAA